MTPDDELSDEVAELTATLSRMLDDREMGTSLGALAALLALGLAQLDREHRLPALANVLNTVKEHLNAQADRERKQ